MRELQTGNTHVGSLATRQVALDLDDGVKVNYARLGAALQKIPGLDAKNEE